MKTGHPDPDAPRKLSSVVFVALLALAILVVIIGFVAWLQSEPQFVYEGFD